MGGEALRRARARKERTYPELAGEGGRARLVVLAAEVGGRWSDEASQFVRSLAWAIAQSAPESTPNPSGTRMESEMEENFGMHSSKVVREHVAGAPVANSCRRHNTL